MGYRRRTIPWPEDMDVRTGWRKQQALRPLGLPAEKPEPPMEHDADPGVERILDAVLGVADAPRSGLEAVRHGPGGNPVRRLAVLALAQLTQREVGQRMGMSPTQVAQILHRFGHWGPAEMDADLRAVEQRVSCRNA